MLKKWSWWQKALAAIFVCALVFAWFSVESVGNHLQYLVPAPAPRQGGGEDESASSSPNAEIREMADQLKDHAEEWTGVMSAWTLGGVREEVSLSCDTGLSVQARLNLYGENAEAVRPLLIRSGRMFSPDELSSGARVMILDEQLALALFRVSEPIDREVDLDGNTWRVIGIARHTRHVGDYKEYAAYIPLMGVIGLPMQLDALQVEAVPIPGTGASTSFRTVMGTWRQGGSLFDLGKERMGARLWLRVLLFVAGMTVVLRWIRYLNLRVRRSIRAGQIRLQRKYAVGQLPRFVGQGLLLALGYLLGAGLIVLLMDLIIKPVYTFPEWIPAVLVEWKDIAAAFWGVWQSAASLRELRSPEILRLRYFTLLIQGCSAGLGCLLAIACGRHRSTEEASREGLAALYRQGAAESVVAAPDGFRLEELGYIRCEDGAYHRVVNIRRLLQQLPESNRDGSFVLETIDPLLPKNNGRWRITCKDGQHTVEDAGHAGWELQMPVDLLMQLLHGDQTFTDFMESHAGYDLKLRSPAMDGLFDAHLRLRKRG